MYWNWLQEWFCNLPLYTLCILCAINLFKKHIICCTTMYAYGSQDYVIGTGSRLLFRRCWEVEFRQLSRVFLFSKTLRPNLTPTQIPMQLETGSIARSEVERTWYLPLTSISAEVKYGGPMFQPTLYAFMPWTGKTLSFTKMGPLCEFYRYMFDLSITCETLR
jgi:hypothetical protein